MPSQAPKYVPNPVPANPEDLPRYIFEEFLKLTDNGDTMNLQYYAMRYRCQV